MSNKPTKGAYLDALLRSKQTIFSTNDVSLLWGEENAERIKKRIYTYIHTGKLLRVRKGFYAKDRHYNRLELATRINTPAYISFETVLTKEGVNFQYYNTLFVASYLNRTIDVDGQKIQFVRMKDSVLHSLAGIAQRDGYACATKERALLDRLYVSKDYHFDNISSIDWEKVTALVPIYHSKRLARKVHQYYSTYTNQNEQNI